MFEFECLSECPLGYEPNDANTECMIKLSPEVKILTTFSNGELVSLKHDLTIVAECSLTTDIKF